MRNPFERLTAAEKVRCEAITRAYLDGLFQQFAQTVKAEDRNWYLDPRNSDDFLRSFGNWLAERRPEFASND